ncbi:MAG TPA: hypothetical protein VMV86_06275 [Methanosarcinales archaeon]|nr:hypothetical protein [Methanosarcinales archaeon]
MVKKITNTLVRKSAFILLSVKEEPIKLYDLATKRKGFTYSWTYRLADILEENRIVIKHKDKIKTISLTHRGKFISEKLNNVIKLLEE